MATPNYSYEKRQRELAKKRKKEEKLQRKASGKPGDDGDAPADADDQAATEAPGDTPPANVG
nr:hypothetical protein [Rivibacter subsaxonicus]